MQAERPGEACAAAQLCEAGIVPEKEHCWLSNLGDSGVLSSQNRDASVSRSFYPTMATLIGRIKLQTVARHRNEKVSVSPSLIPGSGKKKEKERRVQSA